MQLAARTEPIDALRELLRQTEVSGIQRRALLLHTDRLPPALGKPHHHRLARSAIEGLATADRAQMFELSRGRVAIVWRHRGGRELEHAMAALDHLLADLPADQAMPPGQLVSLYDLPDQAAWLLDQLNERPRAAVPDPDAAQPIDIDLLARLEQTLSQADVSHFVRWRPVLQLGAGAPTQAWQERYVAAHDVAANLCPERCINADSWLFRRLTRSFDRRMLAVCTGPQDLRHSGPFALNMNVATLLAPEFVRFDAALPSALRGHITLNLIAADIMADPASFVFARDFVRSRGYRLLLRHTTPALLSLLDVGAAAFDFVHIAYSAELAADPDSMRALLPPGVTPVLTGATSQPVLNWAVANRYTLVRGE